MIRNLTFWQAEADAPLLRRNADYISAGNTDTAIKEAASWVDLVDQACVDGAVETPTWKTSCDDEASQRIFELDAERTFTDPSNRQKHVETLATLHGVIGDYHQGLGFVVAFLLLFLESEQVARLVVALNRYYCPGYYKAAPVSYVRDAKVFEELLKIRFPAVYQKVSNLIPAEAYCSRWFVGLNVHVLPFPALKRFLSSFFLHGDSYLFRFALALIQKTEADIMATDDVSKILSILRLDHKLYPDNYRSAGAPDEEKAAPCAFFLDIIDAADATDLGDIDLAKMRSAALMTMAEADARRRLRNAELDAEEDDEIVFSDEEEED